MYSTQIFDLFYIYISLIISINPIVYGMTFSLREARYKGFLLDPAEAKFAKKRNSWLILVF